MSVGSVLKKLRCKRLRSSSKITQLRSRGKTQTQTHGLQRSPFRTVLHKMWTGTRGFAPGRAEQRHWRSGWTDKKPSRRLEVGFGERTSRGRWLKGLVGAQMLIVHFKVVRISVIETLAFSLLPSPPKSSATASTPMTALCEYSRRGDVK